MLLIPGGPQIAAQGQGAATERAADDQAPKIPMINWTRWWLRLRCTRIRCLLKCSPLRRTPWSLFSSSNGLAKNKNLKDKALADAVQKQPWDPSVQAMSALPDVVKRLADDVQWTTDLGNAFLAQQNDVLDAVQRMRKKAQEKGNLKSNEQMKVETKVVESKQVIVVEQSNPQVVYVPSYDPVVVTARQLIPTHRSTILLPATMRREWRYLSALAWQWERLGAVAGAITADGTGATTPSTLTTTIISSTTRTDRMSITAPRSSRNRGGGGNNWQHNPQHRGGTPYGNKATANKYGGTSRGASASDRQASARQQQSRQQGGRQQAGTMDRGGAGGGRQQGGVPATVRRVAATG